MWRNYAATALRNLNRNRAYSTINLAGLALGFATAIVIVLYVRFERSFDAFWPNADRLFIVTETLHMPDKAPLHVDATFASFGAALKADFPEIDIVARAMSAQFSLRHGDVNTAVSRALWVEPEFFTLFPVRAIAGDLARALSRPDGFVLTQATARQIFGRDNVVGEKLELDTGHVVEVTAVIEDWPQNSHIEAYAFGSGLASFSGLVQEDVRVADPKAGQGENVTIYGRLKPGATLEQLNQAMPAFVERHIPNANEKAGGVMNGLHQLSLLSLHALHFAPPPLAGGIISRPRGDERAIAGMTAVAILIVFVAASNFINATTARASRRATEVGIRKTLGGQKKQLMRQFMAEAMIFTFFALFVAGLADALLVPSLKFVLDRDLTVGVDMWLVVGVFVTAMVTGLLAGVYPALVLASFRPSAVLKGTVFAPSRSGRLRQALVVGQFAVLIALILATLVIYRQTDYAIHHRLRSAGDEIYIGVGPSSVAGVGSACSGQTLRRVEAVPGVRLAGCASGLAMGFGRASRGVVRPDGRLDVGFADAPVDETFFQVFGLKPVAGRLLSAAYGEDEILRGDPNSPAEPNLVINEAAVKALGYATAVEAVGQRLRWERNGAYRAGLADVKLEPSDSEIVGVIPDFTMASARNRIEPMLYYIDPSQFSFVVTSLDGAHLAEAMDGIKNVYAEIDSAVTFHGFFYNQFMTFLHLDVIKQAAIFGAFAVVAIVIGCLGLFSLAVYTAERATKEIGLRRAMGASRLDILRLFGWRFVRPVLIANIFAWPVAYFFMRQWLEGFAYHIAMSPMLFVWSGFTAVVISLITIAGQSIRVARAKPVTALRYE